MTDEVELPRAIALAWGVAAHPQRGPKRELTTERIVDAAVELADAGGLAAVSMAAVASSLGFTTMALYRYVSAKDDLLTLMTESAIGLPPEPVDDDGEPLDGWREGFRHWSRAQVAVYHQHPWVLDVPIDGMPLTPNNLTWLEAGLDLLRDTPLGPPAKVAVVLAVLAQTRWQAGVEVGYVRAAATAGATPDDLDAGASAMLAALVTPEQFPWVHEALRAGVFAGAADVDPFGFGLERVLDGVARVVAEGVDDPVGRTEDSPDVLGDKAVRESDRRVRDATRQLRDARRQQRQALADARGRTGRIRHV